MEEERNGILLVEVLPWQVSSVLEIQSASVSALTLSTPPRLAVGDSIEILWRWLRFEQCLQRPYAGPWPHLCTSVTAAHFLASQMWIKHPAHSPGSSRDSCPALQVVHEAPPPGLRGSGTAQSTAVGAQRDRHQLSLEWVISHSCLYTFWYVFLYLLKVEQGRHYKV